MDKRIKKQFKIYAKKLDKLGKEKFIEQKQLNSFIEKFAFKFNKKYKVNCNAIKHKYIKFLKRYIKKNYYYIEQEDKKYIYHKNGRIKYENGIFYYESEKLI